MFSPFLNQVGFDNCEMGVYEDEGNFSSSIAALTHLLSEFVAQQVKFPSIHLFLGFSFPLKRCIAILFASLAKFE